MDVVAGEGNVWHFLPTNQPKRSYAKRISKTQWTKFEPLIRELHACQFTRDSILQRLSGEGFKPTPNQLDGKLKLWGLTERRSCHHTVSHSISTESSLSQRDISLEDFPVPSGFEDFPSRSISRLSQDGEVSTSSQSCGTSDTDDTSFGTIPSPSRAQQQTNRPSSRPSSDLGPQSPFIFEREGYSKPSLTEFWRAWTIEELFDRAPAVANFFFASQMFEETFELSYHVLVTLLAAGTYADELFAKSILACVRTASTSVQYGKALAITTLTTGELAVPNDCSEWFTICLNLYEYGLIEAYGSKWPILTTLPAELDGLGEVLLRLKRDSRGQDCLLFATRARQSCGDLLAEARLPSSDLYPALTIAASHIERHERYRHRGTASRLLEWCNTILGEDLHVVGSELWEFTTHYQNATTSCQSTIFKDIQSFLANSLFRYLLGAWPQRPPVIQDLHLLSSFDESPETDPIIFDLFEALSLFSKLVVAESLTESFPSSCLMGAAPYILQTVNGLRENSREFHDRFLDAYWDRTTAHASNLSSNSRNQLLTEASMRFASAMDYRLIRDFDLYDTGKDIWPASLPSIRLSIPPLSTEELRPQSLNDPMLWQRRSDSSSLYSHLSATRRGSSDSKKKRQSSASMSVDSCKLSDSSSVRESMKDASDIVMSDIQEEPTWI